MEFVRPYPEELVQKYRKTWMGITLIEAFDRTCDITPEKVAVVEGEKRTTFAQLREKARKTAFIFLEMGIKTGAPVLFQIPNSLEALYVYLALDMIGAVPVLCLPRHGQRELERFTTLTGAATWIGSSNWGKIDYIAMVGAVREKVPSLQNLIVVQDDAPEGFISLQPLVNQEELDSSSVDLLKAYRPGPDDVLHLAPTGGTTGIPKLVPKSHNAQLSRAFYWARSAERGPEDIFLVAAPISHDAPQITSMAFLAMFGGTLVFCPSLRAEDILHHLEKEKITYCFMVPTILSDIANMEGLEEYKFSPNLKIGTGGAWAPPDLIRTICKRIPCTFFNTYGMTEGPGFMTRSTDSIDIIATTVGRPQCPYDAFKIVDDEDKEVPRGEEGELVGQGPCVVSGYYKSEEEDKLAFTPDGFFRTGDIGKLDSAGNLIVTGRKKDLIKRGAETIIPFEIEELISEHPAVQQTAVVGMPDERLGERICAYVQPISGSALAFEELIDFLKEKGASKLLLPERLEIMDAFPLTAMQKINKQALREDIAQKVTKKKK
ncbi:MAG: AMP-binding protein [Deltaproteobacteria bacterium]|nr:AMP-binding protein [Deltaproteobacteria bacterium]